MGTWALIVAIGLWVATLAAARIHDYRRHDGPPPGIRFVIQDVVARTLDMVATLAVLGLAAPFMLLTVIAIKREDGWRAPAIHKQSRVGLDGCTFDAIKFRTMRGPRVTRVGTVIRQLRIDELPLLLNVLRGEVSLILKKDRSLRWAPSAWRDLVIIVGLVLLGIVIGQALR